tara:strand:- start:448 stop:687 length:240 start_codon:yes stop_codon:yes gene_type:complete
MANGDDKNDTTELTSITSQLTEVAKSMAKNMTVIRESLPFMIEYQEFHAKVQHAHYEALCAEGFSEEQALQIVMAKQEL